MNRSAFMKMMRVTAPGRRFGGVVPNRWSDSARAAALASRRAKAAERAAARAASSGNDEVESSRAERDQGAAEVEDLKALDAVEWTRKALAAYKAKYGDDPVTDSQVSEAESLVNMPQEFRTDGAPVPAKPSQGVRAAPSGKAVPKTKSEWVAAAVSNYRKEFGHDPETDTEISWAEEMVGMPKEFQTGGAPVPASVPLASMMQRPPVSVGGDGAPGIPDKGYEGLIQAWEEEGMAGLTPQERDELYDAITDIPDEDDAPPLSDSDKAFLHEYDPKIYRPLTDTKWWDAKMAEWGPSPARARGGVVANREYRVFRLANRVECAARKKLANAGWSWQARAASLAARRAKKLIAGGPLKPASALKYPAGYSDIIKAPVVPKYPDGYGAGDLDRAGGAERVDIPVTPQRPPNYGVPPAAGQTLPVRPPVSPASSGGFRAAGRYQTKNGKTVFIPDGRPSQADDPRRRY